MDQIERDIPVSDRIYVLLTSGKVLLVSIQFFFIHTSRLQQSIEPEPRPPKLFNNLYSCRRLSSLLTKRLLNNPADFLSLVGGLPPRSLSIRVPIQSFSLTSLLFQHRNLHFIVVTISDSPNSSNTSRFVQSLQPPCILTVSTSFLTLFLPSCIFILFSYFLLLICFQTKDWTQDV